MAPRALTGALLFLALAVSAPLTYRNVTDLNRANAYSAAVDHAQEQVVLLLNALMDASQGVHRYALAPDDAGRARYRAGTALFGENLTSLEVFSRAHPQPETSRRLADLSTDDAAYRRAAGALFAPEASRRLGPERLVRADAFIDAVQRDLVALHGSLTADNVEQDATAQRDLWMTITTVGVLVLIATMIALESERQGRRERAASRVALEGRAAALERSNAALQEFAHVASHDLQEPLRMVSSYTQLLARRYSGKLDADADEFIAYAVDGAKRMQVLIENILAYSRISGSEHDTVAIDADAAYHDALANLGGQIAETGAHVSSVPLPRVLGDRGQLAQLFQNLIGNALKYRASAAPEIAVTAARRQAMWTFTVSDNGIGIADEYRERVFGMFQRLHAKTEYSGTGIGLAVCRRIVERHGGTIWIDPPSGHGTTFHFTLKAA